MKEETIKKCLIVLTVICIIIVLLIVMIFLTADNIDEYVVPEMGDGEEHFHADEMYSSEKIITHADYMVIRYAIQQYIDAINMSNINYYEANPDGEFIFTRTEQEISKNVYKMLSEEFINKNNIEQEKVFDYVEKLEKSNLISILEIKSLSETEQIKSFETHIVLQDISSLELVKDYYIIVHLDQNNFTYALEPLKDQNIDNNNTHTEIENITPNSNNTFQYSAITEENVIMEHINLYKRISLLYPEFIYNNILDKEYKEKRFGNLEKFIQYIQKNKREIYSINIQKYQKTDGSDYFQYICINQRGKYYIIREKSITDYSLMLDTYTIDIPEFIEKYDTASETDKVGLNVNKIVEASNNGDYEYIYNKLDETFRQNNFGSAEKLEEYIKNTFYENSVIKSAQCKQEGNTYICTIGISDYQGTSLLKEVKIIMKLLENRDFVMSFAI